MIRIRTNNNILDLFTVMRWTREEKVHTGKGWKRQEEREREEVWADWFFKVSVGSQIWSQMDEASVEGILFIYVIYSLFIFLDY